MTAYQVFGKPITCTKDSKFSQDYIDTYCWTLSTQTNRRTHNRTGLYPFIGADNGPKEFIEDSPNLVYLDQPY